MTTVKVYDMRRFFVSDPRRLYEMRTLCDITPVLLRITDHMKVHQLYETIGHKFECDHNNIELFMKGPGNPCKKIPLKKCHVHNLANFAVHSTFDNYMFLFTWLNGQPGRETPAITNENTTNTIPNTLFSPPGDSALRANTTNTIPSTLFSLPVDSAFRANTTNTIPNTLFSPPGDSALRANTTNTIPSTLFSLPGDSALRTSTTNNIPNTLSSPPGDSACSALRTIFSVPPRVFPESACGASKNKISVGCSSVHNTDNFVMEDEVRTLLAKKNYHQIFECPFCKEFMVAPVALCIKGHSICSVCKTRLENCPLCKEKFSSARNFLVENLTQVIAFPCDNSKFGCEETLFLNSKGDHIQNCPYRLYKCLVGSIDGCIWQGRREDILEHSRKDHSNYVSMENKIQLSWINFNLNRDVEQYRLMSIFGEIFLFQAYGNSTKKAYFVSVHYIGPKEKCLSYLYKVHSTSLTGSGSEVMVINQTHPDNITVKDLQEKTCFCLKDDIIEHFKDESGTLKYELEIRKFY